MPHNFLKQHIRKHVSITDSELELFISSFKLRSVSKKEYLLLQGEVCAFEGFVVKGCLRVYTIDMDGDEHTLSFAVKDWWVTDIDSFTNEIPANLSIQAIEDSKVLLIAKKDKELLYEQLPIVEKLFRIMTQKTHVALQRRMINNLSKTADERYLDFLATYPNIASRLTNVHIASYLGISHEFLSKIRKKLSIKNNL